MAGFVDPYKLVARKRAFSALPIQVHKIEVKTKKKRERKDQRLT
jgi:hypothetical protein